MNKRKIIGLLLILIATGLFGKEAVAENGKLVINNQVIYEKNKEKEDSIEYLIAPDLFLDNKTARDQQNLAAREKITRLAKEKVFVTKQLPETGKEVRSYEKKLFLENYEGAVAHVNQRTQRSNSIPKGLIYLLASAVILGMLVLGIFLGRRFSTVFVRKN
ncbi:hypothetical protein [Candidatus Enterococcus murrayae]|uniref:ESAT-6 secretion machinery protein EssA n=1 Tax=Candidatus Enterococcus murrayae TaxID=2815321 RepID=A0ABS3HBY1_9ENTE|nr:hypothetical protein [Enterococcus sp. MJM16]MBO0450967.1 hypothetical protein [Enterococcus sp. MJM16]